MFNIIVATDKNGVIAKDGKIPWYCKDDFKHFKETTLNSPIIMGRKTFESLHGILPKRTHIVVTSQEGYEAPSGVIVCHSLPHAYQLAFDRSGGKEIFIIGGSEIYEQALKGNVIKRIYLSTIDTEVEQNDSCLFFNFLLDDWNLEKREQRDGFRLDIWTKE